MFILTIGRNVLPTVKHELHATREGCCSSEAEIAALATWAML